MAPIWKLYWCETDDHDEDWFIVALNARRARAHYEDEEGYWRGDATARLVCRVPAAWQGRVHEGWPSHELIEACGGKFLDRGAGKTPMHEMMGEGKRVVQFGGSVFVEGSITDNVLAQHAAMGDKS